MAYEVVLANEAVADIDGIMEYVSVTLCDPSAAKKLFDEIVRTIDAVKNLPYGFPVCRQKQLAAKEIRWAPAKNHTIFYVVSDEKIVILYVKYSRSDLEKLN